MCFEFDAQPPAPPFAGGSTDTEDLVLKSDVEFAGFAARPDKPSNVGMVVLPDVRGLFNFYEELAIRFAEQGINAVAIDYFGRTAGVEKRGEDFEWMPHVMQCKQETIAADVAAAIEYLKSPAGGSCTSIFTVGFCFGGSNSWNQAAMGHGLKGAIGFYGRPGPGFADQQPGPQDRIPEMKGAILGLMGGADPMIPSTEVEGFREALKAAGVKSEIISYADAPHSFFDRTYEQYANECDDAWRRVLAFVEENK